MRKNLGGLAKYTKEEKKKFDGDKPLIESTPYYPDRFMIQYHEFEEPKEFDLWDAIQGEWIDLKGSEIVFGIAASEEEFTQYDFLWCPDGPAFVVHDRVLKKLYELCPGDIQALPMVIKNLDPDGVQFQNKDFWLINILNVVDAQDRVKAIIEDWGDGLLMVKKYGLREDCFGTHLLIRDKLSTSILFHPVLAKHFIKSRGILFLTDEEAPL
ncbi:MAG: hypothetical protein RLZZ59_811 [Pseudomonadota bacterium]|jgi:hypothetical protein